MNTFALKIYQPTPSAASLSATLQPSGIVGAWVMFQANYKVAAATAASLSVSVLSAVNAAHNVNVFGGSDGSLASDPNIVWQPNPPLLVKGGDGLVFDCPVATKNALTVFFAEAV